MEPQRLSNAPIVEAMVTILVAPSEQGSTVSLDQFQQGLETRFPRKQPRYHLDIQFTSQPETEAVSPSVSPRPKELLLLSPEGKRAVQVGPGRFAFSVINAYSTWDDLLRETQELWQHYRTVFGHSVSFGWACATSTDCTCPSRALPPATCSTSSRPGPTGCP